MPSTWEGRVRPTSVGFPTDDLSGHALVTADGGAAIGVQVWVPREGGEWGRVLLRRAGDTSYSVVGEPEPNHSDVELTGSAGPWLFFLRQVGRMTPSGWGFSGREVIRVEVASGRCLAFRSDQLDQGRAFVSSLHGATADGARIFARCGTTNDRGNVEYALSEIKLGDGTTRRLMGLPSVFV